MDHTDKQNSPNNPQVNASRISKMSFWWIKDLFKAGMARNLTKDDIFATLHSHKTEEIREKFTSLWSKESQKENPSTLRLFFDAYGPSAISIGLLFSISETLNRCLQPLFLGALLSFFVDGEGTRTSAYFYASGIVLCSLIPVLTFHPFIYYIFEVAMKIRIGSSGLVYQKILKLPKSAQLDGINGRVINLLSNDLSKFDVALAFLHDLWKGPLETILLGYLAYREIGISGIFGILFILSFIPIQSFIGRKAAQFRHQATKRTDIRVKLMNEIISGIQIIKMYSWEKNFADIIAKARKKELSAVKGTNFILALLLSMWAVSRVSLFLTLVTYVYAGNVLTARKVFVVSAFYNILNESMVHFWPLALTFCAEGYVSAKRLKEFLLISECKPSFTENKLSEHEIERNKRIVLDSSELKGSVIFDNVSASWINNLGEPTIGLESINLKIEPGEIYALIGAVGSGKTTLLQTVLGELEIDSGSLEMCGTISYANQESFIFEGSIRSNILFNDVYDEKRYKEVVSACGLEKDFELFQYGDHTIVGERGISLSGGQKARVNLARAVYRDADIYLLDDPLSAVDSHVGKNIFENCILKYLKGKTVLLVTHQLQYLSKLEHVVLMSNGQIKANGSYKELEKTNISLLMPAENVHHDLDIEDKAFQQLTVPFAKVVEKEKPNEENEISETGTVDLAVYLKYVKSIKSVPLLGFVIILRVVCQAIASFIDYFVAQWVNWEESAANAHSNNSNPTASNLSMNYSEINDPNQEERNSFINAYIIIMSVFVVIILNAEFSFFYALLRASKNLHDMMFRGVTETFMLFFNKNPSGRILNRFSKDIGSIDTTLPNTMFDCVTFVLEIFAVFVLVSIVNIYFIIPTVVMAILLYSLRHVYVSTSRSMKRIESILRSPIFAHVNATINGLSTIRAFNAEKDVIRNFESYTDKHTSSWFMSLALTRAFAFWLDLICVVYIGVVTYTLVNMDTSDIPGGNAGLAITQIIGLIGMTQWGIRQTSELENQMVSVERVLEYAELPSENQNDNIQKLKVTNEWPSKGRLEFKDLSLYYVEEDQLAIKNLNFTIKPQEKIGIVGRTGSGKSSIIQALFRLAKIKGTILIDDSDTKDLTLSELRKNISIIPQDPVLFSGRLRSNLDPFDECTDEAIWNVLQQVELKDMVKGLSAGLEANISDGGSNFSLGQRQLICLGRALLRKNKILVLDEATASVDYNTDNLIQKTIQTQFADCTVLTIAHRLHTVISHDKILVMDHGSMVEFDHPYSLLKNENGYLSKLVNQTGSGTALMLQNIAQQNFKDKSG